MTKALHWLPITSLIQCNILLLVSKSQLGIAPRYLIFPPDISSAPRYLICLPSALYRSFLSLVPGLPWFNVLRLLCLVPPLGMTSLPYYKLSLYLAFPLHAVANAPIRSFLHSHIHSENSYTALQQTHSEVFPTQPRLKNRYLSNLRNVGVLFHGNKCIPIGSPIHLHNM